MGSWSPFPDLIMDNDWMTLHYPLLDSYIENISTKFSKSWGYREKATSEQLNSTQRPQLGKRGNGMSETEGKKEDKRKKLSTKMERNFCNIDKSQKHRWVLCYITTLFNNTTWFFARICTVYQMYGAVCRCL